MSSGCERPSASTALARIVCEPLGSSTARRQGCQAYGLFGRCNSTCRHELPPSVEISTASILAVPSFQATPRTSTFFAETFSPSSGAKIALLIRMFQLGSLFSSVEVNLLPGAIGFSGVRYRPT